MHTQPNVLTVDSRSLESHGSTSIGKFRRMKQGEHAQDSTNFTYRDGRRWHNLDSDAYVFPNDETEGERLDRQHEMLKIFFDGALCLAPMTMTADDKSGSPRGTDAPKNGTIRKRLLDVGTGTGVWAIEFAEQYPSVEVVGIDISPIQPTSDVPQNCSFIITDAEKPWTFSPSAFDYIHARLVFLGLRDWRQFFQRCYDNLQPGGWLESLEYQFPVRVCDQDTVTSTSLTRYSALCKEAGLKAGVAGFRSEEFSDMLQEIGFENRSVFHYQLPIGAWAAGEKFQVAGRWMEQNVRDGLPAMSILIQRSLGRTKEDADEMTALALKDMEESHTYTPVILHIAQKPFRKEKS